MMESLLDPQVATLLAASAAVIASIVTGIAVAVFSRGLRLDARMARAIVHETKLIEQAEREAIKEREVALDCNPFYRNGHGWNLTEQSRLLTDDYSRAEQLAKEAGVQIPDGPCRRVHVTAVLGPEGDGRENAGPAALDNVDPSYWGVRRLTRQPGRSVVTRRAARKRAA